jgi:hypothetical protein
MHRSQDKSSSDRKGHRSVPSGSWRRQGQGGSLHNSALSDGPCSTIILTADTLSSTARPITSNYVKVTLGSPRFAGMPIAQDLGGTGPCPADDRP